MHDHKRNEHGKIVELLTKKQKLENLEEMAAAGLVVKTAAPGKVSAYDAIKKNLSGK